MTTTVSLTAAQVLANFNDIDALETCLCDLDDSEFVTGGRVYQIVRDLGYEETGRQFVNDQRAWGMTVHEWAHTVGI